MNAGTLLDAGTELLRAVLRGDQPADAAVATHFRQHRQLGARDRHVLTEMVFEVLRRRLLYQHLARLEPAQAAGTGLERRFAIAAWPGGPAPLQAALSPREREWLAHVERIDRAALPDKLRHNLPDWLAAPLQQSLGEGFWPLVDALATPAPLDLRVNALKAKRDEVQRALEQAGHAVAPTPHSPWGLRLQGKPALHREPALAEGLAEVQDEGSQLLALLVGARRGEMVVDFCAGAGGKTLALGAAMRNTGRLYAFDVSGHRLDALKPRLARSGLSNVHPAQIAHERDDRIKRLAGKIDRVLVDVPCSGLGTLRRRPDLKWKLSPQALAYLQAQQRAILASAARLLKTGGRLVYATCSLLEAENAAIADAFTAEHAADWAPLQAQELLAAGGAGEPQALVQGPYLQLWPHVHRTDGFFAAAWQRR